MHETKELKKAKEDLLVLAVQRHNRIFPCSGARSIESCFTVWDNRLLLWFNTEDHNTHLLTADMAPVGIPRTSDRNNDLLGRLPYTAAVNRVTHRLSRRADHRRHASGCPPY
jgi:hypothetical protein